MLTCVGVLIIIQNIVTNKLHIDFFLVLNIHYITTDLEILIEKAVK